MLVLSLYSFVCTICVLACCYCGEFADLSGFAFIVCYSVIGGCFALFVVGLFCVVCLGGFVCYLGVLGCYVCGWFVLGCLIFVVLGCLMLFVSV